MTDRVKVRSHRRTTGVVGFGSDIGSIIGVGSRADSTWVRIFFQVFLHATNKLSTYYRISYFCAFGRNTLILPSLDISIIF